MKKPQSGRLRSSVRCAAVLVGWLVAAAPAVTALPMASGWNPPAAAGAAANVRMSLGPGIGGRVHAMGTHVQRSMGRVTQKAAALFTDFVAAWFWTVFSVAVFLLVAALSSVVDVHMLDLRRHGTREVSLDLGHGLRLFFRLLRDRRAPMLGRIVLALALAYWLLPYDLVPDRTVVPGFLDDLVVTIIAAKVFMYLCPDSLVARHAATIEWHAQT